MIKVTDINDFIPPEQGCSVALGFFDGVHLGHQQILNRAAALAQGSNERSSALLPIVYTFTNHPTEVLTSKRQVELLTTGAERLEALGAWGLECVCEPFTAELAAWEPERFLEETLLKRLKARAVVCGLNYTFGQQAAGNMEMLRRWGAQVGIKVEVAPLVSYADERVSSSRLRQLVRTGKVVEVRKMLGRPFSFSNVVVRGQQLGRSWGIPTANLSWPEGKVAPAFGAYACLVTIPSLGASFPGVGYFGSRPTVNRDENKISVEINIGHFSDGCPHWNDKAFNNDDEGDFNLYGQRLEVQLLEYLAPQERFQNVEELQRRIQSYRERTSRLMRNS